MLEFRTVQRSIHPVANIFPEMNDADYAALKKDISLNGLMEPIWTYNGQIIDGRHRYRACCELSVIPSFREWDGDGSLVDFVVSLNLHRRHLSSSQLAVIGLDIERELAVEARERQRGGQGGVLLNQKFDEARQPQVAEQAAKIGTNRQYISDAKRIAKNAPELLDDVKAGLLNIPDAVTLAKMSQPQRTAALDKIAAGEAKNVKSAKREVERDTYKAKLADDSLPLNLSEGILFGDMREVGERIPDNSVDLILTDPPYDGDSLPLYEALSRFAERTLRPGGLCLVYSGQIYLPQVIANLSTRLEYAWTGAVKHGGGNQRVWKVNVNTGWKPVLFFVKPPLNPWWDSFIDIVSGGREKDLHEWQQAEAEAAYFIENLTIPDGLVVDPFCGSGTSLVAAKRLGRRYIGIEINPDTAVKAAERVKS